VDVFTNSNLYYIAVLYYYFEIFTSVAAFANFGLDSKT